MALGEVCQSCLSKCAGPKGSANSHILSLTERQNWIQDISRSDTTMQPSVISPSAVSQPSLLVHQVMDQFQQMLSSFLGLRQEATITAFCNYLAFEAEALEDGDFQTFKNETVKLLSSIQSSGGGEELSESAITETYTF